MGSCVILDRILMIPDSGLSHVTYILGVADVLRQNGFEVHFLIDATAPATSFHLLEKHNFQMIKYNGRFHYHDIIDANAIRLLQRATRFGLPQLGMLQVANTSVRRSWMQLNQVLEDETLMERLRSNNYKMVLNESCFYLHPWLLMAQHLGGIRFGVIYPVIGGFGGGTGIPMLPSVQPSAFSGFSDRMTLPQRLRNFIMTSLEEYAWTPKHFPEFFQTLNKDPTKRNLGEIVRSADLYLVAFRDPIGDYPHPSLPNVINIGSPVSRIEPHPLTNEFVSPLCPPNVTSGWHRFQSAMDAASDGVVIIALPSLSPLRDATFITILSTIERISSQLENRKILFIAQSTTGSCEPSTASLPVLKRVNLMLREALPFADLLAHKNVRGLVTNGNNGPVYAALHNAIPLICIPRMMYQYRNTKRVTAKSWGFVFDDATLTVEKCSTALYTLLENPGTLSLGPASPMQASANRAAILREICHSLQVSSRFRLLPDNS